MGWNRLRRMVQLHVSPLRLEDRPRDMPDLFPSYDTPEQACSRGFLLTDDTIYEVARPTTRAKMAALSIDGATPKQLALCPNEKRLRIHSLDKDNGKVYVLMGSRGPDGYRLLLATLDRAGHVLEVCREVRSMPAGEPSVVGLAGAGDSAFLAWSTGAHILLARFPLKEGGGRPRRWVLDQAPRDGPGVVRVGVVNERLFVAWEGHSPNGRWSLKLLRTEIEDLP